MFEQYELIKCIGRGANAEVFLVKYKRLEQLRAMKRIHKNLVKYNQWTKEIYILKHLKHPCIPIIYDIEEDETYYYIFEEYMEGESLVTYRRRYENLSESTIISFSIQICELIEYLHSREYPILYLDLKPSNLLIEGEQIKLVDFGAAKIVSRDSKEESYGTKGYAAPEQYKVGETSIATDIYGIGMMMYYLLTGRNPRGGDEPIFESKELRRHRELCKLIHSTIRHNPLERYESVKRLEKRLHKLEKKYENTTYGVTNKSTRIGIIGAQARIGVTHLALLLQTYLTQCHEESFYIQKNDTDFVSMCKEACMYQSKKGFCLPLDLVYEEHEVPETSSTIKYQIEDYGAFSIKKLEEFLTADIRIAVVGGKPWERVYRDSFMAHVVGIPIIYVYNFMDSESFRENSLQKGESRILRMPFCPNPLRIRGNVMVKEFLERILDD